MRFDITFIKTSNKDKCPMVNIDSDDFAYANIKGLYKDNVNGHGIQVNNRNKEKSLMKMCDKIAQAVYEYDEEINKHEKIK